MNDLDKLILSIKGDNEKCWKFINDNMKLIYKAVHKSFGGANNFIKLCNKNNLYKEDDLISEAKILAFKAIEKYDINKGSFTTILFWEMYNLRVILRDKESIIKMPRKYNEAAIKATKYIKENREDELTKEELHMASIYFGVANSLDKQQLNEEGDDFNINEKHLADKSINVELLATTNVEIMNIFNLALKKLEKTSRKNSELNKQLVYDYFFNEYTGKELSQKYDILEMQVSRLIKRFKSYIEDYKLQYIS